MSEVALDHHRVYVLHLLFLMKMAHFTDLIFLDQYLSKSFDVPYQWDMKIAIKYFLMFLCAFELSINICPIIFHYIYVYNKQNV